MFSNFIKSWTNRSHLHLTSRPFCSLRHNIIERLKAKEEGEAIGIEANLFDQSSVKHEPVSAEDILNKNKNNKSNKNKIEKISLSNNNLNREKPQHHRPAVSFNRNTVVTKSRVIDDDELGLQYIRLSLGDHRLATMLMTARSKKRRDKYREIIIEGRRLISEALECNLTLKSIIFSQKDQLLEIKDQVAEALKCHKNSEVFKVPQHDLKMWSTLTTPPGIMAVFERPDINVIMQKLEKLNVDPLPLTVVCDNIREPNNLGSIIRTCAALPCFQIVVTKGCCDPWDSKALRGGCGGHFRVPIRDDVEWQDVLLTIPTKDADDCYVFVAENNLEKIKRNNQNKTMEYMDVTRLGSHNIVIIGGESHGVSEEAYRFMQKSGSKGTCLNIPLAEGVDSLNVASALTLILYELRKTLVTNQNEDTL